MGEAGEGHREEAPSQGLAPPGQRKKQTTVNAATRAAREAGVHTQGRARAQWN